jgi:hypothetical protein
MERGSAQQEAQVSEVGRELAGGSPGLASAAKQVPWLSKIAEHDIQLPGLTPLVLTFICILQVCSFFLRTGQ